MMLLLISRFLKVERLKICQCSHVRYASPYAIQADLKISQGCKCILTELGRARLIFIFCPPSRDLLCHIPSARTFSLSVCQFVTVNRNSHVRSGGS